MFTIEPWIHPSFDPLRQRFSWPTFWTAVGSVATVATVVVTIALQKSDPAGVGALHVE
jgi:hypothetical protein